MDITVDSIEDLAKKFVIVGNGCWVWQRARTKAGYGEQQINGKMQYTHRIIYTIIKGKIPSGYHMDHLCRNRACCNPNHLEAVTQKENLRRGIGNINKFKTHCKNGHEFNKSNTAVDKRITGDYRRCITCQNVRNAHMLANRKLT